MSDTINHGKLNVGDAAPDFDLPDEQTMPWVLHGELKLGPAVLSFYRGDWSPYCNGQLAYYARNYGEFEKRDAKLVGISLDPPRHNLAMVNKLRLQFPLLSDPQGELAKLYGLWNEEEELPYPSVVVVDRGGKVSWIYRGHDFADQPTTSELFDSLDGLGGGDADITPEESPQLRVPGDDEMDSARPDRPALSVEELMAYFRGAYYSTVALESRFSRDKAGGGVSGVVSRYQDTVRSYGETLRQTAILG